MKSIKKQKEPLTVAPLVRVGLVKIGERHGEFIDEKFKPEKPKDFVLKKKKQKQPPKKGDASKAAFKEKQRTLEKRKRELRLNPTQAELFFWYNLKKYKISHIFQKGIIDKNHFMIADFYIKRLNIVVELDGGYHNSDTQKARDYFKDKHYSERGFRILRLKNEDVEDFNYKELKKSFDKHEPTEYLLMHLK